MNAAAASVFALLAKALPQSFRRRYGDDMRGHFEEELRESGNLTSRLGYIFAAYGDVLLTAITERFATIRSDLVFSGRSIRKSPGFAIVIVMTLALAIGANTTVFSVLRAVILAPFPFPQSDRIAVLHGVNAATPGEGLSLPDLHDIEHSQTSIVATGVSVFYMIPYFFRQHGSSIPVEVGTVTPGFFTVFGLGPERGRYFQNADARPGAASTIVLSDRFWRKIGADPSIVGNVIRLSGSPYRVIGIAPAAFSPGDVDITHQDAWTALIATSGEMYGRNSHLFGAVVRLSAESTIAQTQRELDRVTARLQLRYPTADGRYSIHINSLLDEVVGDYSSTLLAIFWAVVGLLVIACANVANLMLGRASSREYEIFVRLSLGATRARIMGQLLTETFVLVAIGGLLGVGLAFAAVSMLVASHPDFIPRVSDVSIDPYTLGYTALIVVIATLLAGLVPAVTLSRRDLTSPLSGGGRGGTMGRGAGARATLVVFEIACTLALVVLGGLSIRNYAAILAQPLGFDPANVSIVGPVTLTGSRYRSPQARLSFLRTVRAKIATMPGFLDAAWAFDAPFVYDVFELPFTIVGDDAARPQSGSVEMNDVDPNYFHVLRIPTIAGRAFRSSDADVSEKTLLVNEAFVRKYLHGRPAVGTRIQFGSPGDVKRDATRSRIVGVVGDTRRMYLQAPVPTIYRALGQNSPYIAVLVVRTRIAADPAGFAEKLLSVDPMMVSPTVATVRALMEKNTTRARVTMQALVALAGVALVLAIAGVFAVVSYGVSLRTHEFGIRMALGSTAARIHRDVVARAMRVSASGIVAGTLLAAMVVRVVPLSLTTVEPLDVPTFAAVIVLMTIAALVAALIPALRATRVDPTVALRSE